MKTTLAEFCAPRTCLGIKISSRAPVFKSEKIIEKYSLTGELPVDLANLSGEEHEGAFYWNNEDYGQKRTWAGRNVFAVIITSDIDNLDLRPLVVSETLKEGVY